MNIYEYIDNYGIYTFKEKKLNEVDAVIFSFLSYADFTGIFSRNEEKTLNEVGKIHVGLHRQKDNSIIAVKEGNKLLQYLKDSKRYKDCRLRYYEYIGNDQIQFGAISIEFEKNHVYISFEGTDQLFSGWIENFMLSYQFPTISHQKAIQYLNKHYTFSNKKLIVGGHSKGGNLALVSSMYANSIVRSKIEKVYNVDGPGLLEKEFLSRRYAKIKRKYLHILPDYSLVGLFLNHDKDKVVKSTNKGILAHNIVYWQIDGTHFHKTKLSTLSKELDDEIKKWFDQYKDEDKKEFIKNLDLILKKANIKSIVEIKENQAKIFDIIYESREIEQRSKEIINSFIKMIIKCIADTKKEEWKSFISEMFRVERK